MERNTASNWSSRSFSEMSMPTRVLKTQLHARALDEFDFAAQHGLGQAVFGNREAQHAARFSAFLEDRDVVAQQRQVERGRQPGGSRSRDGDLLSGRRAACARRSAAPSARSVSDQ